MKIIIKYILMVLLVGCANIQPPSGGPPDETPPKIILSEPPTNTIKFADDRITVEFSEYVEHSSVTRSINMQPELKTEYKWAGKKLHINLEEVPDSNLTYSITFGTSYTDMHKNKPEAAYTIIFSSGSKLDSGVIDGKLYSKKADEYSIFAYNITEIDPDTLRLSHTKYDYKVPLGSDGSFSIKALKDGIYRLICIKDTRNDGFYNKNSDFIFNASQDFIVKDSKSSFAKFKTPQFIDEIPPELSNAKAISEQIIELAFNEPVDTNTVKPEAFSIADSAHTETYKVKYAFIKPGEKDVVQIITETLLDTLRSYQAIVNNNSNIQITDTAGNSINDTIRTLMFKPRRLFSDIIPRIIEYPVKDSSAKASVIKPLIFTFTTAVNMDSLNVKLFLAEDSSNVSFKIDKKSSNMFIVSFDTLADNSWYRMYVDTRKMTGFNGIPVTDSLVKIDFKTIDQRSYGAMNGSVRFNKQDCPYPVIKIINQDNKFYAMKKLKEDGSFNFENIPAGKYTFEIFCDENNNMKIDGGYPYPFKFSEKFFIPVNEVNVKSRWTFDNILLYVGEERKSE